MPPFAAPAAIARRTGATPRDPPPQPELLLERHGIVTREHVLAEGIAGGSSSLYDSFTALETLGVCQRGEPLVGSPYEQLLLELGFRAGPRKLTIGA
jgi:hypothetical protein